MNAKTLAKNYGCLTPEERFRLIAAAGGRGDKAERDRLCRAAGRITLSMSDHAPYAHAFDELALLTFMELLEEAARYFDLFARADDIRDCSGGQDEEVEEEGREAEGDEEEEADERADAPVAEGDTSQRSGWQRSLDLALAAGYVLRAKAEGWKLFCARMNVPPFLVWRLLPGFERLQRALALTEKAAFVPQGFLRWLNRIRPAGERERIEVPLTAEGVAAATEETFRQGVGWWSR